jgi:hypothetical protein
LQLALPGDMNTLAPGGVDSNATFGLSDDPSPGTAEHAARAALHAVSRIVLATQLLRRMISASGPLINNDGIL